MINPFRDTIVANPWNAVRSNVREINADAFKLCCNVLKKVRNEKRSASVMVLGEPGSGKSHLLSRLQQHLKKDAIIPHVYVSVRLQAGPRRFWRHIRRCFVESILRKVSKGRSQLEVVFSNRLFLLCKKPKISNDEMEIFMETLREEAGLSPDLCIILRHIIKGENRADAINWLKGDSLTEVAYKNLGLPIKNLRTPRSSPRILLESFANWLAPQCQW